LTIPALNFRITDALRLGQGGETEKFNDNLAAIRAIKTIEAETRRATPEEQALLARYVGWGGLAAYRRSIPLTAAARTRPAHRRSVVTNAMFTCQSPSSLRTGCSSRSKMCRVISSIASTTGSRSRSPNKNSFIYSLAMRSWSLMVDVMPAAKTAPGGLYCGHSDAGERPEAEAGQRRREDLHRPAYRAGCCMPSSLGCKRAFSTWTRRWRGWKT
jgi:hypothetical protein